MIGGNVYKLVVLALQVFRSNGDNYAVLYTENLALNKWTSQSSGNTSHLAINGDYGDFAEIPSGDLKWWSIDLGMLTIIEVIKVHNQKPCCESMLVNLSIVASSVNLPGTPTWNEGRFWDKKFYRMRPAKYFMVKLFYPVIKMRHVAITSNYNQPLRISEVEISGGPTTCNVARGKPLKETSSTSGRETANINNGMYDDYSMIGNHRWEIDLLALYTTHLIRIYRGPLDRDDEQKYSFQIFYTKLTVDWRLFSKTQKLNKKADIFTNGLVMKRIALEASSLTATLAEIEVFVEMNVAFRKPTHQSSTYNERYHSGKAVNGYFEDFTHTDRDDDKNWSVDLLSVFTVRYIQVFNRKEYSLIYINPNREVRYITIRSRKANSYLSLAEVIVKEYNFAIQVHASHEQINRNSTSDHAVDEDELTYTDGLPYSREEVERHWKVKLRKTVLMTSVAIHFFNVRTSGLIQIKTSKMASPQPVTLAEHAHWSLCHVQETTPFEHIHLECNRNQRYPLTRHLSIQPHAIGQRLTLREVEIYGKRLPELIPPVKVTIKSVSYTSVEISFSIWNLTNVGAFPPTSYKLTLGKTSLTHRFLHNYYAQSGEISIRLNDLYINTTYASILTCQYKGTPCNGPANNISIATLGCQAPEQPLFSWSFEGEGINRRFKVIINEVEPNCVSVIEYRVVLTAENNVIIYDQSTETAREHLIGSIASDITHNLLVEVTNNEYISSSEETEILAVAKVPARPTLSSHSFTSNCVHINVFIPSEHVFQFLKFIFHCTGGYLTIKSISEEHGSFRANKSLCGFPDNALVTCEIQAENNVGKGLKLIVNGSIPQQVESTTPTTQRVTKPTTAKTSTEASTSQQSSTKPAIAKNTTEVNLLSIIMTGMVTSAMVLISTVLVVKRRDQIRRKKELEWKKAYGKTKEFKK